MMPPIGGRDKVRRGSLQLTFILLFDPLLYDVLYSLRTNAARTKYGTDFEAFAAKPLTILPDSSR
jgi:hypothetical protein